MENFSDFDFYLKFTKPLVLNLPKISDKVLAAAWVKKLMDQASGDEKTRLDHLKLLLFVLQRKTMAPPFNEHPNGVEALSPLGEDKTLVEVAKTMLEQEHQEKLKKQQMESGDYPPYFSDFSADLLEYAAVQNIDNFGVHGYLAVSKMPLNTWNKVEKQFLPKAAKSMIEVSPGPPPTLGTSSEPALVPSPEKEGVEGAEDGPQAESTPKKEGVRFPEPEAEPAPEAEPPPPEGEAEEEPAEEEPAEPAETPPPPKPSPKASPRAFAPFTNIVETKKAAKALRSSPVKSTLGALPPSPPLGQLSPPFEDRRPPTWGSNLLELKDIVEETEKFEDLEDHLTTAGILAQTDRLMSHDIFQPGSPFGNIADFSPPPFLESPASSHGEDFTSPGLAQYLSPGPEYSHSPPSHSPSLYTSAASLPYLTPPLPRAPTPPAPVQPQPPLGRKPRRPPKVKQTRSSLLLQKKKEAAARPPPVAAPPEKKTFKARPAPKVKPVTVKGRSSAVIMPPPPAPEAEPPAEEAPPAPPVKKVPSKSGIPRKPTGKKKAGKRSARDEIEGAISNIIAEIYSGARPEGFKGFSEADDIDTHLDEYNQMLQEMEEKYRRDRKEFSKRWKSHDLGKADEKPITAAPRSIPSRPKRSLSRIAKRRKLPLPKAHGVPVPIEKEIHASPEAMEMLEEFAELPGPTGEQQVSSIRHPSPRLSPQLFEEEGEEVELMTEAHAGMAEERELLEEEEVEEEPVFMPGKNRRVSQFYERMIATSRNMSPILEADEEAVSPVVSDWDREEDRAERQMPVLETVPVTGPDLDDFEAMERMVEEEMKQTGEDPNKRQKRLKVTQKTVRKGRQRYLDVHHKVDEQLEQLEDQKPQTTITQRSRDFDPGIFFAGMGSQDLEGMEDQVWVSGPEFFKDMSRMEFPQHKDMREKPAELIFPGVDFDEEAADDSFLEEDELDQLMAESPPTTPEKKFQEMQQVDALYHDLLDASPGLAGVPATTPRPSASPRRQPVDYSQVTFSPPPSPEDQYGLPAVEYHPSAPMIIKKQKDRAELEAAKAAAPPPPPPKQRTPSPPPSPPHDYEDDVFITVPPEALDQVDEEEFFYASPDKMEYEIKKTKQMEAAGVSPPRKEWYMEAKAFTRSLHGTPDPRHPDVFDLPGERVVGESPPQLASPERSPISPPIDAKALRDQLARHVRLRYNAPYKRRVGPTHIVERYSHGPIGMPPVPEDQQKEALLQEDLDLQEELRKMKRKKRRGREIFRFPTLKRKFIQRHSRPPQLATVREVIEPSPPKTVPNVFDLPDMWDRVGEEGPPEEFFDTPWVSPKASPEDPAAWKAGIQDQPMMQYDTHYRRRVGGRHRVDRRSPAPGLAPLYEAIERGDEEEWERRNVIAAQSPMERGIRRGARVKRPPGLRTVSEHLEYPVTPVSSRQITPSPRGTLGPRRRTLRKRLKKKRMDFSQPQSPDEIAVEVEHIESEVEAPHRPLRDDVGEIPELPPEVYRVLEGSPPEYPEDYSPKTPPTRTLDIEPEPGYMGELVDVTPPTPRSEWANILKMKEEVRQHQWVPRRKRRRRLADQIRQRKGRLTGAVEEQPLEERAAILHEELEREVEAEMAAAEAEQHRHEHHLVDEPVPGGLPSPMKPITHVPGYETPPHLRRPLTPLKPPEIKIWPAAYKNVLQHQEMPDFGGLPDGQHFPEYTPPKIGITQEQVQREFLKMEEHHSPGLMTEEVQVLDVSPTSPRSPKSHHKSPEDLNKLIAQYLPPPQTAEEVQRRAERQFRLLDMNTDEMYAEMMAGERQLSRRTYDLLHTPPREAGTLDNAMLDDQPGPSWRRDDIDFEYQEVTEGAKEDVQEQGAVQYDSEALHQLGVSERDMRAIALDDSPEARDIAHMYEVLKTTDSHIPRYPMKIKGKYIPTRYKYIPQYLAKVEETDRDTRPPSPMGMNMRWDLSPASRVQKRIPDVQVAPSPLKDSRFKFSPSKLEEPPKPQYHRLLPPVISRSEALMYPYALDHDIDVGDVDLGLGATDQPPELLPHQEPDVFEQIEQMEYNEEAVPANWPGLEEEEAQLEHSPPPPPYRSPPPVSPSKLRGELEMHEMYDPDSKRKRKTVKVKGRTVKLRSVPPRLGTIYEGTPPKRVARPRPPSGMSVADVMALADRQYDELVANKPIQPRTPSPETLKYRVGKHKFDPRLYHKTFRRLHSRPSPLSPPAEGLERLQHMPSPRRVAPMGVVIPSDAPQLDEDTPPMDYYQANYGALYDRDMEVQDGQMDYSPTKQHSPEALQGMGGDEDIHTESPPAFEEEYYEEEQVEELRPHHEAPVMSRSQQQTSPTITKKQLLLPPQSAAPGGQLIDDEKPPFELADQHPPGRVKTFTPFRPFQPSFEFPYPQPCPPGPAPPFNPPYPQPGPAPPFRPSMPIPFPPQQPPFNPPYPQPCPPVMPFPPGPPPRPGFGPPGPMPFPIVPPFPVCPPQRPYRPEPCPPMYGQEVGAVLDGLITSAKRAQPFVPPYQGMTPEGHGLPGVETFQKMPATPKRPPMAKRARRLKFERSPRTPETPEGPHVTVMTVEAQIHAPPRTPRKKTPSPPAVYLGEEEMPPYMEEEVKMVERYESPGTVPDNLVPFGGRTSPGVLDTSPIHYEDELPEDMKNFRWMDVERMD